MRDLPALKNTVPLPKGWADVASFWPGVLGLGLYAFMNYARTLEEKENMKELECRNVALAMVANAAKLIEHLASNESSLRTQIASMTETLTKERADHVASLNKVDDKLRASEALVEELRTSDIALRKQITELQAEIAEVKVPSPISISTPAANRRKRRVR